VFPRRFPDDTLCPALSHKTSLAPAMVAAASTLGPAAVSLVLTLPAIGQAHVLSVAPPGGEFAKKK